MVVVLPSMLAVACGGDEVAPPPSDPVSDSPVETTEPPSSTSDGGSAPTGPSVAYPDPEWATGAPGEHGLDPAQLDVAAEVAAGNGSYCLLVIRDGKLLYEKYWQGHDPTTPQLSYSVAKSYSSALVGVAIERGDLDSIDQSVADFLPSWQGTPNEAITIRHLLSMTSGLKWSAFSDYVSMVTFADDHSQFAEELDLNGTPGAEWTYHNGGVQLLEPVFRAATGMTMEAYAEAYLWSRIGMTASWAKDPAGNPTAYASVVASCRDHARLGYLYMHGGAWAGEQVVPASWVSETTEPSQNLNQGYGYLWWLNGQSPAIDGLMNPFDGFISPASPPDMFAAWGFGNQFIDVIPSLDMIVVRFGEDPWEGFDLAALFEDQRFEKHEAIITEVMAALVDP
jgi:CubicO group peptidase (beta-lactamase class C family)